jgi:HD superfamily phosphohydrolase
MIIPKKIVQTSLKAVDVSDFLPIVTHPIFLKLGEKTQLSFVEKVYVGGKHTRLEHSYFVYHFADELTKEFLKKDYLTEQQIRDVKISALLHDLGHPPFSHSLEYLLGYMINKERPKNHHDRTIELLESDEDYGHGSTIREAIENCGGKFKKMEDIISKSAPESSIISHNTLGVDKLAYTLIDAHHTGYTQQLPFILDIFPFYVYDGGEIGIAKQKEPHIMNIQKVIQDMYSHVFFNNVVKQFGRIIQKATEEEIISGNLKAEEVWNISEGALVYLLENSSNENVRALMQRYFRNDIDEKPALAIKIQDYSQPDNESSLPISNEFSYRISKRYKNPQNLTGLEDKICTDLGLPSTDLLVVLSAEEPERLIPEDVNIYDCTGKKLGTLFNMLPKHYESLKENSEAFFALNIYAKDTNKIIDNVDTIKEILNDDVPN